MNAAAQLCAALVTALVLWLPSLTACLRGDIGLPNAALRYLAAYVVARIGIGILARLYESYAVDAAVRHQRANHARTDETAFPG
jgi:hypothetical protein